MILLPAIDILEGKAVRLTRGEFDQSTVYDADPVDAARRWVEAGARFVGGCCGTGPSDIALLAERLRTIGAP